ncbi:MAG: antitoxin [Planctomycetota bacterium]
MANLQVKGMDDGLYRALGQRAKLDNRSISQEVVVMIQECLALSSGASAKTSLGLRDLAGAWEDKRSAAAAAKSLRRARRGRRRFGADADVFA